MDLPVDAGHDGVLTEWGGVLPGLLPDVVAVLDIVGRVEGVVDADYHDEGPRDNGEHPVGSQGAGAVSLPTGKRVEVDHFRRSNQVRGTRPRRRGEETPSYKCLSDDLTQ